MNWIDTIYARPSGRNSQQVIAFVATAMLNMPKRVIVWLVRGLLDWQRERMERAQLRGMSEHMLKDLGITRWQADGMARAPWARKDFRKPR